MPGAVDLFKYARARVYNKSPLQRIGHSAKLDTFRRVVDDPKHAGSTIADLVGAGARKALMAIPIPVLPSLISTVAAAAQRAIKQKFVRDRQLADAESSQDTAKQVKFELKDLSVESLDRYRWKVEQAVKEFNNALEDFNNNFGNKMMHGYTCRAYLEVAYAGEQASRRIRILRNRCAVIKVTLEKTLEWLDQLDTEGDKSRTPTKGVVGRKNDILMHLDKTIHRHLDTPEMDQDTMHRHCKDWCFMWEESQIDDPNRFKTAKNRAAAVLRFVAAPFSAESPTDLFSDGMSDTFKPSDIGSKSA